MQKKSAKKASISDPIHKELDQIKKLLMLALLKEGIKQADLARALGMDPADVSRMMPASNYSFSSTKRK